MANTAYRGVSATWGRRVRRGDVATGVLPRGISEGPGPVHKAHVQVLLGKRTKYVMKITQFSHSAYWLKASPIIVRWFFSSLNWNWQSDGSPCGGWGAGWYCWAPAAVTTCRLPLDSRADTDACTAPCGLGTVGSGWRREGSRFSTHQYQTIRTQAWVARCFLVNGPC